MLLCGHVPKRSRSVYNDKACAVCSRGAGTSSYGFRDSAEYIAVVKQSVTPRLIREGGTPNLENHRILEFHYSLSGGHLNDFLACWCRFCGPFECRKRTTDPAAIARVHSVAAHTRY